RALLLVTAAEAGSASGTNGGKRDRLTRMRETEVERRLRAHRAAHDMCAAHAEMAHDGHDVLDREAGRVARDARGHVGRRITPRIECDATVTPAEVLKLRFPASQVTGKFMNEDDRCARPRFFV